MPAATRSPPPKTMIGIVEVAPFAAAIPNASAAGHYRVNLAADEVGGQCGHAIIMTIGPAIFSRHVSSFDVAGFAQALVESGHVGGKKGRVTRH